LTNGDKLAESVNIEFEEQMVSEIYGLYLHGLMTNNFEIIKAISMNNFFCQISFGTKQSNSLFQLMQKESGINILPEAC